MKTKISNIKIHTLASARMKCMNNSLQRFLESTSKAMTRMFGFFKVEESGDEPDSFDVYVGSESGSPSLKIYKVQEPEIVKGIGRSRKVMRDKYFYSYDVCIKSNRWDEPDDTDTIESAKFNTLVDCLIDIGRDLVKKEIEDCAEYADETMVGITI